MRSTRRALIGLGLALGLALAIGPGEGARLAPPVPPERASSATRSEPLDSAALRAMGESRAARFRAAADRTELRGERDDRLPLPRRPAAARTHPPQPGSEAQRAHTPAGHHRQRATRLLAPTGSGRAPTSDTITGSLSWPQLDALRIRAGTATVAVTGSDPLAPRALLLWQRAPAGRPRRLARTRSGPDGRFDFGQIDVPNRGLALVVTDLRGDPREPTPLSLVRESLAAPQATLECTPERECCWHFLPARIDGDLIVHDADEIEIARLESGAARTLCLHADEIAGALYVAQQTRAGGHSESRCIQIERVIVDD